MTEPSAYTVLQPVISKLNPPSDFEVRLCECARSRRAVSLPGLERLAGALSPEIFQMKQVHVVVGSSNAKEAALDPSH